MRILRSQYLQLSKNGNESIQNPTVGKKALYKSHTNNGNQHTSYFNEFHNNEQEVTILSQTSTRTITTKTTNIRRQSLMLSNTESRLFRNTVVNDQLDELNGFNGFPETNHPQQSAPASIKHRRQTLACPHGSTQRQNHTMHVKFLNVPDTFRKFNITVEFVDMGPLWLTRIYQGYENDLWLKKPRPIERIALGKNSKWHFYCLLCFKKYCKFDSLKSHLNFHLELYPYGCKLCTVQYTNRRAITTHLRTLHGVNRANWNEFIGN